MPQFERKAGSASSEEDAEPLLCCKEVMHTAVVDAGLLRFRRLYNAIFQRHAGTPQPTGNFYLKPAVFLNMADFPNENTADNRKPPTEQEVLVMLERGDVKLPPVEVQLDMAKMLANIDNKRIDGFLKVRWRNKSATFLFEYKSAYTPSMLEMATEQARSIAYRLKVPPLIIMPYLSDESLRYLDNNEVSGIDLCGNGILISEDFQFWRSGQPNRYKDTRPIRNPFQGDSSIFARCFLLRDQFSSLKDLVHFARERTFAMYPAFQSSALTQGTASKVVQALIEDLIVRKRGADLVVQDKRRLLKRLRQGHSNVMLPKVSGTSMLSPEQIWGVLSEERNHNSLRAVATGLSSASYYKVLSGVGRLAFYVNDMEVAINRLQFRTSKAFANIELYENKKNTVYFDARQDGDKSWASPIQTWLELMDQGPREQEAAVEIEQMLLAQRGAPE